MPSEAVKSIREAEIGAALTRQQDVISDLQEVVSNVRNRFESVLRSEPIGEDPKGATESSVPLVGEINYRTSRIVESVDQLRTILSLCELP